MKAALLGLVTPLCSCGALPVALGFAKRGVQLGVVVAFLTATQSAGLDSAAITVGMLGWRAALCRLGGAVILAVCAGMAVPRTDASPPSKDTKDISEAINAKAVKTSRINPRVPRRMSLFLEAAVTTAADIFPLICVGLAFSTAARTWLPSLTSYDESLDNDSNSTWIRPLLTRLFILASAIPLQLCEHTTVTLAAGLQKAGGSPGLAFAFLLSAPATNLPTLLLLLRTQRGKDGNKMNLTLVIARVVAALCAAALALSYAVDAAGIDMMVEQEAETGVRSLFVLPAWYIRTSPVAGAVLAVLAIGHKLREWARGRKQASTKASAAAGGSCCSSPPAEDGAAHAKCD